MTSQYVSISLTEKSSANDVSMKVLYGSSRVALASYARNNFPIEKRLLDT